MCGAHEPPWDSSPAPWDQNGERWSGKYPTNVDRAISLGPQPSPMGSTWRTLVEKKLDQRGQGRPPGAPGQPNGIKTENVGRGNIRPTWVGPAPWGASPPPIGSTELCKSSHSNVCFLSTRWGRTADSAILSPLVYTRCGPLVLKSIFLEISGVCFPKPKTSVFNLSTNDCRNTLPSFGHTIKDAFVCVPHSHVLDEATALFEHVHSWRSHSFLNHSVSFIGLPFGFFM